LVAAACIATALWSAAPAAAQVPSLSGEQLVATGEVFGFPQPATPGEFTTTGTCNPEGTSTFSFTATGPAFGPYPGTFEENGTFSLVPDPSAPNGFSLSAFHATFTIDSVNGEVTGTKEFADLVPGAGPSCRPTDQYQVSSGASLTNYEATIRPAAGGTYTTEGQAESSSLYNSDAPGEPANFADFSETFLTGTPPVSEGDPDPDPDPKPERPTTAEECRAGGFRDFPALGFGNQGDCVAFVQTGGRNEPGKNVPRSR
jgi:hypothetical protein